MSRPRLASSHQPRPKRVNQTVLDVQITDLEEALQAAEATVERLRARDHARKARSADRQASLSTKYRDL